MVRCLVIWSLSKSFVSWVCRLSRLVSVNGRLSSFSKSFESASPGGVISSPAGFLVSSSFGFVSFVVGRAWSGFVGTNTRLEV